MTNNSIARVLLFLNAHKDELLELGAAVSADESQQTDRFDRRVLTERFLMVITQGTAAREPITLANSDLMVRSARQLTDLFLAELRRADELEAGPFSIDGAAPAQS